LALAVPETAQRCSGRQSRFKLPFIDWYLMHDLENPE